MDRTCRFCKAMVEIPLHILCHFDARTEKPCYGNVIIAFRYFSGPLNTLNDNCVAAGFFKRVSARMLKQPFCGITVYHVTVPYMRGPVGSWYTVR